MRRKNTIICCVMFVMTGTILLLRSQKDKITLDLLLNLIQSVDKVKQILIIQDGNNDENQVIQKQPNIKLISGVLKSFRQIYDYVENPATLCNKEKVFGGIYWYSKRYFDGDKIVCIDSRFKMSSNNCDIYSFGIANEWSFDDAIAKFGCHVYAFDPTMSKTYDPDSPNKGYKRGDRIYFFPIGLGGKDYTTKIKKKTCELRRMKTILEYLGHNNTEIVIDYLKIDIEGSEIEFLEDLLYKTPNLLYKFNQIGMEIHPKRANNNSWKLFSDYYKYFIELENRGYTLFSSRMNPISSNKYKSKEAGRVVNECYEMVWARF